MPLVQKIIVTMIVLSLLAGCTGEGGSQRDFVPSNGAALSTPAANSTLPSNRVANCAEAFPGAQEVAVVDYFNALQDKASMVWDNQTYSYVSPYGHVARNGPFATWWFEMFIEDVSFAYPIAFESFDFGGKRVLAEDYRDYASAVCSAYAEQTPRRNAQIAFEKLLQLRTDWTGHASHWDAFPYIETGAEVIPAPSPKGLEHYTKYITGAGVVIVGGDDVPDGAMLAARESVVYLTSARPEFRTILQENEVRISLFEGGDTSILPEYPDVNEPGGMAMGRTDVSMTANSAWLCYPGHQDIGGDPVIHEMVHTINHVVFEQINETYFYERIYGLALDAIEKGVFGTSYSQKLADGESQGMHHYVGEYWAMTVEGYIMNRPGFKDTHDSREWIAEHDPMLLDLIQKYYPATEWKFCE